MPIKLRRAFIIVTLLISCPLYAQDAEPWQAPYSAEHSTGEHVIAFWNFEGDGDQVQDLSGNGHHGRLAGAKRTTGGRFGTCIESFPGWPVEDSRHAAIISNAPALSPAGAFTIEMWISPGEFPEGYGDAYLLDKKYVAHTDYQWVLSRPNSQGLHPLRVSLGFGEDSETWYSPEGAALEAGIWSHLAFTYDGGGTVQFFHNGRFLGNSTIPGRGGVHPGNHNLSLGDRIGSYYHGFPGKLDEIRITNGVREFRPLIAEAVHKRNAYIRMEPAPTLQFRLTNLRPMSITNLQATIEIYGSSPQSYELPPLEHGESSLLEYVLDTKLRPDEYQVALEWRFKDEIREYVNRETFPVNIVPRPLPHRMPVVMWGVGGVTSVLENLEALNTIGFTHCLGLRCDYASIWEAGASVPAVQDSALQSSYSMLDEALVNDLGIVISLSPGRWLQNNPEFQRIDRSGETFERGNLCGLTPGLDEFMTNVGASVSHTYGEFPAFNAALIHTEVRDGTQVCFHDHDYARCKADTGADVPDIVASKTGVHHSDIQDFPEDRVIRDDHEVLAFYQWFWSAGDGWKALHSALHRGLKTTGDPDFWTFYDPAVRVPPLWGSGGTVDYLSHWTYSYPNPVRIGLATDELFAMARGGPSSQDVMKMTQIIWYRSQTAPADSSADTAASSSPWEDYDPGANYITISPAHLREAFWTKISRPIKGIMYHGWQSLVPVGGHSSYRFTHPETRHALQEVIQDVVKPLGPTLLQVPAVQSDVAFLESFSSSIFAGRGTYGWGRSWAGDAYHILLYAHLQPEVVYEETILHHGLDAYRVLVLADCDVLPQSIVRHVRTFQEKGGLVIGDARLCPAIKPDMLLDIYTPTRQADRDKEALLERAQALRRDLEPHYRAYITSSAADVLPYRRRFGTSDYIFAINDQREFGGYVGHHGLVMEQGLPASASFKVIREPGYVYDLVEQREAHSLHDGSTLHLPVEVEPGGGGIWLITEQPIDKIHIRAPEHVDHGQKFSVQVAITDNNGRPVDAVIPLEILIKDPDGRRGEYSGYYGAAQGQCLLTLNSAPNDVSGVWTIHVRELASRRNARHTYRLGG